METAISWLEKETFISLETAEEAGRSIQWLLERINTSEQLEKILAIVGRLMDVESPTAEDGTAALVKSRLFCLNLARVLDKYAELHGVFADFSKPSGEMNHAVYELSMFIMLGVAEKSPFLKKFVGMLSQDQLSTMVYSVCSILQVDTFYYTQEMALELIARLCHLMLVENQEMPSTSGFTSMSAVLKVHLTNRKSIFELLKDMRPVLNRLNESNPNIITYPLASIQVQNLEVTQASWLDLCGTHFCFHSETVNAYLKFPLEAVVNSRVVGGKNQYVEVTLSAAPEPWQEFLAAQDLVLNSPLKLFFMDPEDAKAAVTFLSREHTVGGNSPTASPIKSSAKKEQSSAKPERTQPPKEEVKQEEIPRIASDDISSLTIPDMDQKGVEEGRKISTTRASKAKTIPKSRDTLLTMGEAHTTLRPKTPPEVAQNPIDDADAAGTEGENESESSEEKPKPKRGRRSTKTQTMTPKSRKQPATKATSAKKTPAKKTPPKKTVAATPASKTRAQKATVEKELITPVEEALEPMSTRKRPRSQDSEGSTGNRAKMRAVSMDTAGKREVTTGAFDQNFGEEGWNDYTDFGNEMPFENERRPIETELIPKPEEAVAEPRAARLRSYTTPAVNREKDWGKEDIVNAAPATSSKPPARGSLARMRSPNAVQDTDVAVAEPPRRVPLQPLSANVDKTLRPQSASSQPSAGSATRGGPTRKYGKQSFMSIAEEEEEQSQASEMAKAKAEDQRKKQEQQRQMQEKKRRKEEQAEKDRKERQRREEKERKDREDAERKEQFRAEERERRLRKDEEEAQEQKDRFLSISQEIEMGLRSEHGATSSRTRSSKRTRDESFAADAEEDEAEELPWDRDAGTSHADESTALSKLIGELKTLPEKRKRAKRRKRLKNIEISANDQLKAYMNQVILFLSFHLKEIDNTFRNGYDNMQFSVQNTVSTSNTTNEMNALQKTLDEYERQRDETRRVTASFNKQVNDLRNQEQEAVSSYHRSINQARHSARNRALDKIRSSRVATKASSNDIFEQLRRQGIRL